MEKHLHRRRTLAWAATAWAALVLFLMLTNPSKLPVSFVVVPYLLFLAALWLSWSAFCNQIFAHLDKGRTTRKFGHVVAVAAMVCMALQSIGQLSIRDMTVVVLVCLLGFFYVHRMGGVKRNTTE